MEGSTMLNLHPVIKITSTLTCLVENRIWQLLLQFRIANYQALMAKYNHTNYTKLNFFIEHLSAESREQFQAI